jgi:catechol 2,3-dioxygenase-like lactoylglutathione lyase family enzyme
MPTTAPPFIECEQIHAGLAIRDLAASIDFYTEKLGFKLAFPWGDPATFAGMNPGKVQIFLQKGTPNPRGSSVYFLVGDGDLLYEFHRANGVEVAQEIGDREYAIRDYVVRDLNGYHLSFGHHIFNVGEPIKIERVEVPVRLEKRLAALLEDLAKHKHSSVSSCLEEMLQHTNEGVGPHTQTTVHYIRGLKRSTALITTAMPATGLWRGEGEGAQAAGVTEITFQTCEIKNRARGRAIEIKSALEPEQQF